MTSTTAPHTASPSTTPVGGDALTSTTHTATVAATIADVVGAYTREIFGVMGNGNALFIDAATGGGVNYSALRHEAGAVAAADAFARATGGVGVATTTFGAGFTNTLTALTDAVRASSPLVIVTGDTPTTGSRQADVDIPAIARRVGASSFTVEPGRVREITQYAIESALRNGRPAVLSIPYNLAGIASEPARESEIRLPHAVLDSAPKVAYEAIPQALIDTIFGAERLLILAGRGAVLSGAELAAQHFARARSAMTATTALAHGLFGDYPRHLGVAGGFGSDRAAKVMASADVVLVLGAGLSVHTTRNGGIFGADATVIQVDIGPTVTIPAVTHRIRSDVSRVLSILLQADLDRRQPPVRPWKDLPRDTTDFRRLELAPGADGALHPQLLSRAIAKALPAKTSIVVDGGNFMAWPVSTWPVDTASAFVPAGLAFQSIGLGLPALVGAALAHDDRLPVLAVGDGGLSMALADLESIARLVKRGVIVVYNDSAYGAELHQYAPAGLGDGPMRFPTTDFAGVARALGMQGVVVTHEADLAAFTTWLDSGQDGIMLLDCRIADDVSAPFLTAAARRSREVTPVERGPHTPR